MIGNSNDKIFNIIHIVRLFRKRNKFDKGIANHLEIKIANI